MISERHTESLIHLEPMHVHWMNCAKCGTQREKCAQACERCYLYMIFQSTLSLWRSLAPSPGAASCSDWTRSLAVTSRHWRVSARTRSRVWAERFTSHVHESRALKHAYQRQHALCALKFVLTTEHSFQDFECRFAQRLFSDLLAKDYQPRSHQTFTPLCFLDHVTT